MEHHEITNSELERFANSSYVDDIVLEITDDVMLENSLASYGIRITEPLEIDFEVFEISETYSSDTSVDVISLDGSRRELSFIVEGGLSDEGIQGLGRMAFAMLEPPSLRTQPTTR